VLISVDGLRPDVIATNAPNIRRLQLEGSWATDARTISKSSTLPSHASMVSGVDYPRHGLGFNAFRPERGHIQYPTIFSAAQQAGLATALFVGKMKLKHLLDPASTSHFQVGGLHCSRVNKLALPYLHAAEPGLVFLHFSDPDNEGHQHGWMSPEYLAGVTRADRCVGQVVEALKDRGALDRTLLVLTADHGGHNHDHAADILPDTRIPWMAWGGAAAHSGRIARRVYNTDTAATILHALGLPMPADIEGKPVLEALAPPAAFSAAGAAAADQNARKTGG
jgi:arylsulfatase A-like enzyme